MHRNSYAYSSSVRYIVDRCTTTMCEKNRKGHTHGCRSSMGNISLVHSTGHCHRGSKGENAQTFGRSCSNARIDVWNVCVCVWDASPTKPPKSYDCDDVILDGQNLHTQINTMDMYDSVRLPLIKDIQNTYVCVLHA